jgi:hypothetical protein
MENFVHAAKELDTYFKLMEMRKGMSEKEQIEAEIKELELEIKTKAALLDKHKGAKRRFVYTSCSLCTSNSQNSGMVD